MRKSFGVKPYTYPQPVYIISTYNEDGSPNAMNAAWGGMAGKNKIFLHLASKHKTVKNILNRKEFSVSLGEEQYLVSCDYVGLESGNKVPDKFNKSGFTETKSKLIDAPLINELAVTLECKLINYDCETEMLIAEIMDVSVDETALDKDGNVDVAKLNFITFDPFNSQYVRLGDVVGNAFHDGTQLK